MYGRFHFPHGLLSVELTYTQIAEQYATDVISGTIPACKWVKAACQRHFDDLKRMDAHQMVDGQWSPRGPFQFNPVMTRTDGRKYRPGDYVCDFISAQMHVEGEKAGTRFIMEPWQIFTTMEVFGWVTAEGKRRFRRVYFAVPRGNGKSAWTSAIALYMLSADGEGGAQVYAFATTREQAGIVFGVGQQMVRIHEAKGTAFAQKFGLKVMANSITQLHTGSIFKAKSSQSSTQDGLNVHFASVDEFHAHKTRDLYDVVETGAGKRKNSMIWCITTAGFDRSGICYEHQDYGQRVLDKQIQDDQLYCMIYTIDDGDDWSTEESLLKANPNWGVSVMPEILLGLQHKAKESPASVNNFITKHLNVWVNAHSAWMDMQKWDACADHTMAIEDFAGRECWIGLDLASKNDIAAKVILFRDHTVPDGFVCFTQFYLPSVSVEQTVNSQYSGWARQGFLSVTEGDILDFEIIKQDIEADLTRFDVQEIGYDPFQATMLASQMMAENLPMLEIPATVKNFSDPMKQVEAWILAKKLRHNGNPVMSWMMSNVVCRYDQKDNIYPNKEKNKQHLKIDGPVALIMCASRAILTVRKRVIGSDYSLMMVE